MRTTGSVSASFVWLSIAARGLSTDVYDAENAANAVTFLNDPRKAFPFRMPHVLTDRGSCFTADDFERTCARIKVNNRKTKPYTAHANGMGERFSGRIAGEVLGINVTRYLDFEILLTDLNRAYNLRLLIPAGNWL